MGKNGHNMGQTELCPVFVTSSPPPPFFCLTWIAVFSRVKSTSFCAFQPTWAAAIWDRRSLWPPRRTASSPEGRSLRGKSLLRPRSGTLDICDRWVALVDWWLMIDDWRVLQGWFRLLHGVHPWPEPSIQQEHGEGLGERLHRLLHHLHGVQWSEDTEHFQLNFNGFFLKMFFFSLCAVRYVATLH